MTKPSVLIISYHFYPSREVGAKRPSETALYLHRQGFDVTVLRGRHWNERSALPDLFAGMPVVTVVIPRQWISELWFALKRLGRSYLPGRPRGGGEASAASAGDFPASSQQRMTSGWFRRQVAAFETFIQGDKRWLLKCALVVLFRLRRRRFDAVIASGPPMAGYICGTFAARVTGSRLILDLRDPWYQHGDPERSSAAPGHVLCRIENRIGRACVAACETFVVASPGIDRHLRETFGLRDKRVSLIRNGYDPGMLVESTPPIGRLSLLYAGTLYWNRNPFPLLESIAQLCGDAAVARSSVSFTLAGQCEEWNGVRLRDWIASRGLEDVVRIVPPVDTQELRRLIDDANVLVNFAQGQPRQIPAKTYEYIAAGREVLTIAERDGDVSRLLAEAGFDSIVEPGDQDSLLACLRSSYRRFVTERQAIERRPGVARFSRSAALAEYARLVEEVVAG